MYDLGERPIQARKRKIAAEGRNAVEKRSLTLNALGHSVYENVCGIGLAGDETWVES